MHIVTGMMSTRRKSRCRPPWRMAAVVRIWMCRFLILRLGVTTFTTFTTTTRFTILPITHAFSLGQPSCSFRRRRRQYCYYDKDPTTTTTRLSLAIIYDPDGQRVKDDEYDYLYFDSKNKDTTALVLQDEFQHHLQNNKNMQQVLIRIACAYAPPPHDTLLPSQVVSWNLVSLQPLSTPRPPSTQIYDINTTISTAKTMLQVALGLPQEEDESTLRDRGSTTVAQILVEIPLSTSCDSIITTTTSEEDPTTTTIPTLIDAIIVELEERLDPIACRILHSREEQEQQNVLAAPSEWQQRLPDDDDEYEYDLPEWWTMNGALTDECTLLRSILNEDDFTKDLLRLASTTSSSATNTCSISWSQVKVVLVGPSGIILRATSSSPSSTTTTIPIRFDTIATTSEMLRSLVLDLVEEEEQPQAKDAAEKPVVGTPLPPPPLAEETMDETTMTTTDMAVDDVVRRRRQQPKSPQEEAQLAAKYAAISNVGDRAYTILKDLGMI